MAKQPPPSVTDLHITKTARFLLLPKELSKVAVRSLFDDVLQQSDGHQVAREIRVAHGTAGARFVHSFLCFRTLPPVPFLDNSSLRELRFGFVLLIERQGYLAVFHRAAKGLDDPITKKSRPVDRKRLTHIWSSSARYQKLSTRRMTIAKQELRGASYEADDLEMAIVPATAARSILQSIRLATQQHGSVGVTPSTGRIRASASKTTLGGLVAFVDDTIRGIENGSDSAFLSAFPEPVELDDLPADIVPVGVLVDTGELHERLDDPSDPCVLHSQDGVTTPEPMLQALSTVLLLREDESGWQAVDEQNVALGHMKRLKNSYSLMFSAAKGYTIEDQTGASEPLADWLRRHSAFSVSFSSPEYFYSDGRLFRKSGFAQEVEQVRRFFRVHRPLDLATSEKGTPYDDDDSAFEENSIFRIVETGLAVADHQLWCCDLGDEWADYIGVGAGAVTFYHCKHGTPTTGASDFQIVVGQALKNLSRIKFRPGEVLDKIRRAQNRDYWGSTRIPLLAKDKGGWQGLERDLTDAIADPNTIWRVALVVSALSMQGFEEAAARPTPTPHFIQLVWLLSAFASACRERDAQPMIICRS